MLELYNAVNGTTYDDPEKLTINTLENAVYMFMQNDVSDIYSALTKDENLYGSKLIKLPTPEFLIFYNGSDNQPDTQVIKLSDAFEVPQEEYSLELRAVVLNINRGHNPGIMKSCKTLRDYAEYTARVREYAESVNLEEAVERAITECIRENILSEFLSKYRAEAKTMSLYEYDEEKCVRKGKLRERKGGSR